MNGVTWDWHLFELLNFDGGRGMDALMESISGVAMWIPLYIFIIYMVWRAYSWRGVLVFLLAVGLSMGLSDMVAGIFKHSGMLKDLWTEFPARERPMFCEGLTDIHVPSYAHGRYGTISAHAATIVSLALLSSLVVRRRWFTVLMVVVAVLISYSRLYLACHFPQDILLGTMVGIVAGFVGYGVFKLINNRWR